MSNQSLDHRNYKRLVFRMHMHLTELAHQEVCHSDLNYCNSKLQLLAYVALGSDDERVLM